jgi:hypothetical protein
MKMTPIIKFFISLCLCAIFAISISAQNNNSNSAVSEQEKTPALVKHLPDWENTRNSATYISNAEDLRKSLGERAVFDLINLGNGIEAAAATYPQGKLLIVEYPTPQASIDADAQFKQRLETPQDPPIYYRRIGNYSAFVFDASDEPAANALLDGVKYEKYVQWLGENPMPQIRAEREFAIGTGELFLSTVIFVAFGFGSTILVGVIIGLFFFYMREQKRATTHIFTDAGGMTRLNLDGLTSGSATDKLLKD